MFDWQLKMELIVTALFHSIQVVTVSLKSCYAEMSCYFHKGVGQWGGGGGGGGGSLVLASFTIHQPPAVGRAGALSLLNHSDIKKTLHVNVSCMKLIH